MRLVDARLANIIKPRSGVVKNVTSDILATLEILSGSILIVMKRLICCFSFVRLHKEFVFDGVTV